jgi:bifunctional non-homologous end joining protein LigD
MPLWNYHTHKEKLHVIITERETMVRIGRYTVKLSHEEKLLFPRSGITKKELIEYYQRSASVMLPYLKNRPLTMHRFPSGISEDGFYQKDAPDYFPAWIERVSIPKKEGEVTEYVVCQNTATLVYIANQNCITPHIGLSSVQSLAFPDRMIFDLDPATDNFDLVRHAAYALKAQLDEQKLPNFAMTTGSRGVHVVVPLKPTVPFEQVREYARALAQQVVDAAPKKFTLEIRKEKRGSRLLIDYLRNSFGATSVAPYAVRAKENAPVATPLLWDELADSKLNAHTYTIATIGARLEEIGNPWASFFSSAVSLKKQSAEHST